ncbi:MAG: DUF6544 family protein [Albidovulum sp.]
METAAAVLILAAIGVIGAQTATAARFRSRTLKLAARLHNTPATRNVEDRLPPIVAEFARRAGAEPDAGLRIATFAQDSDLRLRKGGRFRSTVAWQVVALGRAGFLWDARQSLGPVQYLRVIDAYVGAEGMLEARLFGSVPLARMSGRELALGEAFRYLAELPWAPDAILGNPDLVWRVTGPDRVEVRLATQGGTARVTFRFDGAGDIVGMEAQDRPARDAAGLATVLDWRGSFGDYRQIGPRRLPEYGEVGYVWPGSGYEPYFRGRIRDYHLAP